MKNKTRKLTDREKNAINRKGAFCHCTKNGVPVWGTNRYWIGLSNDRVFETADGRQLYENKVIPVFGYCWTATAIEIKDGEAIFR